MFDYTAIAEAARQRQAEFIADAEEFRRSQQIPRRRRSHWFARRGRSKPRPSAISPRSATA